jgi:hypothetical protein
MRSSTVGCCVPITSSALLFVARRLHGWLTVRDTVAGFAVDPYAFGRCCV